MSRVRGIAITRPREDALKEAGILEAEGIRCFIVPMLEIEPLPQSSALLQSVLADAPIQAICVTSKHALPMLAAHIKATHAPLFVVGKATGAAASDLGFQNIHVARGTVESLLAGLEAKCSPDRGTILYARGEDVTLDITATLRGKGYGTTEVVTYKAHPTSTLPEEYIQALQQGEVDEVRFYSERSAANYVHLIMQYHLLGAHRSAQCYCLSDKITVPLRAIPWRQISLLSAC